MTIDPPPVGIDASWRPALCLAALSEAFNAIAGKEPDRPWDGDEANFWPLRAHARKAGWTVEEIDATIGELLKIWHHARVFGPKGH